MFESITICKQNLSSADAPLDMGFLAECLLFYRDVRIVADHSILRQLVRQIGPDLLLDLLDEKALSVTYFAGQLAVTTNHSGSPFERHDACVVTGEKHELGVYAQALLEEAIGRRGRARRLAGRLVPRLEATSYPDETTERAREDFLNGTLMQDAVANFLEVYAPEYQLPLGFVFRVRRDAAGFFVETNLDFGAANDAYHRRVPVEHSSLTPAYLLSFVTGVQGHLFVAADRETELATESVSSELLKSRVSGVIRRAAKSRDEVKCFQDLTFGNAHALGEAINSGERSFQDLHALLGKADRFKAWLTDQAPEESLLHAYYSETTHDSWIDRLPSKTVRWSIFSAAGLGLDALGAGGAGTIAGLLLGAGNTFLLDRILKGWKPSHFVRCALSEFVAEGRGD